MSKHIKMDYFCSLITSFINDWDEGILFCQFFRINLCFLPLTDRTHGTLDKGGAHGLNKSMVMSLLVFCHDVPCVVPIRTWKSMTKDGSHIEILGQLLGGWDALEASLSLVARQGHTSQWCGMRHDHTKRPCLATVAEEAGDVNTCMHKMCTSPIINVGNLV